MADYLLAVVAVWITASVIAMVGHAVILRNTYESVRDMLLDEQTGKRRFPLYFIGRLAFAFVLVYLLRQVAPVEASLLVGLELGVLVGVITNLPLALDQFASFPYPPAMILGGAAVGLVQCAAAGVVAALLV